MPELLQDARYGLRSFTRDPGFALVAILTLALGVGATTSAISVIDGVLLRPLPYPGSDRLIYIGGVFSNDPTGLGPLSPGNVADLEERAATLETFAGSSDVSFTLLGAGDPELIDAVQVGRGFFDVLGVAPALGRAFAGEDFAAEAANVAVLEHGFWRERWGSDPEAVGSSITLDGDPYTIVGVLPADFYPPEAVYGHSEARLWTPLRLTQPPERTNYGYQAIARLAPGSTLAAASAEIGAIFDARTEELGLEWHVGGRAVTLREQTLGQADEPLLVLLLGVALLLLIACANVANLMLARGTRRGRELAVRRSLGAGRWRIGRQLLTESVLLALAGGLCGALLSYWTVATFKAVNPGGIPRLAEVGVDLRVLLVTLVLSTVVGLLFGVAPALQAFRGDAAAGLRAGSAATGGSVGGGRSRGVLVVAETALALILLIGAALLANSFARMSRVDPGFDTDPLMSMRINLRSAYPDRASWVPFFHEVLQKVRAIPGVQSASLTTSLPFSGIGIMSQVVPLDAEQGEVEPAFIASTYISDGHFRNIGMTLLEGIVFEPFVDEAPLQVIVNETLARQYWPAATSVLGKRILVGDDPAEDPVATIIGTVGSLRYRHDQDPLPEMYFPMASQPWRSMWVIAKAAGDPAALAGPMREALWAVDGDLPIDRVAAVNDLAWSSIGQPRFYSTLAAALAGAALALSLVGLYGTLSYSVGSRVRELGIRMALGAEPSGVIALVLRGGLRLTIMGLVLGTSGAWGVSWLLERFLFGIAPTDPPTFLAAVALFVATALFACWIPARRASRLDPVRALRSES